MNIEEKAAIVSILLTLVIFIVLGQFKSDEGGDDIIQQIQHLIYIGNKYIFTTSSLIALIVFSSIYISKEFKIINQLI